MNPKEFARRYPDKQFFHFTDTRNLQSIRDNGGLLRLAEIRRRGIQIPAPGGNKWSHEADAEKGFDEYVHLCFKRGHPMEFAARERGQIADVHYLEISPEVLDGDGILVTMDVSNKRGIEAISWKDACQALDFEVLYGKTNWKEDKIQERLKAAEKCELLIPSDISLKLIKFR